MMLAAAWAGAGGTAAAIEPDSAVTRPEALAPAGDAVVAAIESGAVVHLDDGRTVALVGLRPPDPPVDVKPGDWVHARAATEALAGSVRGRRVSLWRDGPARDRHRRPTLHLVRDDGLWIQAAMVAAGLARVDGGGSPRALHTTLLGIEAQARKARLGLWSDPYYAVASAENAGAAVYRYALIEGRVREARRIGSRVYWNFGADWRDDFTVALGSGARRAFKKEGIDPLSLQGRAVRVRGWVQRMNGPMIEIAHPQAVECLAGGEDPRETEVWDGDGAPPRR